MGESEGWRNLKFSYEGINLIRVFQTVSNLQFEEKRDGVRKSVIVRYTIKSRYNRGICVMYD